jgi:hypothetical protein
MGHHHYHDLLRQTVAYGFSALLPISILALLAGARWEAHKRKHGRTSKPGSSHEAVSARFASAADWANQPFR